MNDWSYDGEWMSTQNSTVKRYAQLKDKKTRIEQGIMILEGPHMVEEALIADLELIELLISDRGERVAPLSEWRKRFGERTGKWIRVSDPVMEKLSDAKTPQGVMAIVRLPQQAADPFWQQASAVIVLDGVSDPGNLGTIIRTAAAMGIDGIWLGDDGVDLFHPKTMRATQGAIFQLPFRQAPVQLAFDLAMKRGAKWLALTPREGTPLHQVDATQGSWWVIGSEAHGVREALADGRATRVSIPMSGKTESLNAAMAATIACYEIHRQRILTNRGS